MDLRGPRHGRPPSREQDGDDASAAREDQRRPRTRPASSSPSRGFLPFPSLLLPSIVLLFVVVLFPPQLTIAQPLHPDASARQLRPPWVASNIPEGHLINDQRMATLRQRRQSNNQEGLWQLYWRLMSEGNNDTVSAFQQIRQLFSTLIAPERPRENQTTTEKAPVTAAVGGDKVDGAARSNETATSTSTTTTEPTPRKISTGELMGIFRRNVFGLGRLFGREFWNAIQESNKNIQMYSKEWQDAIRPFVQ